MQLELTPAATDFLTFILTAFEPPPETTVPEWAAEHRIIPRGNAEPGRWRNDRAPYLVEPMEAATDDAVTTLVIAGCSQSGKTALAENIVGHAVSLDPCTILWSCPNDASSESAALRFDSIIAATPDLKARFGSRTARSQTNNAGLKEFLGGKLVFASAGSPSSLASHPARLIVGDEIDRWPVSLRREGDPVAIIQARTTTFARGKSVFLSSPTQEGASRIEALHATGDQREWNWRCECGADHVSDWANVQWTPKQPETARYVMPCCGVVLDDAGRWAAMERGRWIATAHGQPGVRSYRFRGLSSPWLKLALLAAECEAAGTNPTKAAPFWNTRLGLPFNAQAGEGVEAQVVRELAESYAGDRVPERAALIVAAIDVQAGWLAVLIAAVGDADELWGLQWHEVVGDVKDPATRAKVEQLLDQQFVHASGAALQVEAIACDAGFETQTVLEWSQHQRAKGKRFFATKGAPGWQRAIWERGGDITRSLARFFLIGVDQGKQQVVAGLAQHDAGPGKIHTPAHFENHAPHWWSWATAEHLVETQTAGGTKKEWKLRRGERRNEALDVLVLCLAVSHSADFGIPQRLQNLFTTGRIAAPRVSMADLAAKAAELTHTANGTHNVRLQ